MGIATFTRVHRLKLRFSRLRIARRPRTASSVKSSGCTPASSMRCMISAARSSSLCLVQHSSSALNVTAGGVGHKGGVGVVHAGRLQSLSELAAHGGMQAGCETPPGKPAET